MDILPLLVRLNDRTVQINANLNWSIYQLKQQLYLHNNIHVDEIKVVFAGSELDNSVLLKNCEFANGTTIHAIIVKTAAAPVDIYQYNHVTPTNFIAPTAEGIKTQNKTRRARFYIYCKSICDSVQAGKLRVRCKQCKDEAFEISSGPNSWQDVLKPDKVKGRCNNQDCNAIHAQFFFKCAESKTLHENESSLPLPLLRTNIQDVPCLACMDITGIVLVFPCQDSHVICLECFALYCQTRLDQRQFTLFEHIGYTLACPGLGVSCHESYIEDVHHFCLAGKAQYERYKNFATEEFVLKNGGLLCPGQGCGNGLLLENANERQVVCCRSRGGCGLVFCRSCRLKYHDGECDLDHVTAESSGDLQNNYEINVANANQARWRRDDFDSRQTIGRTTKPCLGCRTPTEKSGGCNHMTCSRCQLEWCWLCHVQWSRNCEADHWFRAG